MEKYLLAGLGNIGDEYNQTRHNIGFDILDAFVNRHGGSFSTGRLAMVARLRWKGKTIVCIKPTTYMNLSGKAVRYWLDKENIQISHLLVLVDEKALPLSRLRLRPGGSDAGHNGLKSVQESLATIQYPRLRFGIGDQFPRGMQVEYVLGRWTDAERPLVNLKIDKSVEAIENFLTAGLERTMTQVNNLDLSL